jgi:hypothetical protein
VPPAAFSHAVQARGQWAVHVRAQTGTPGRSMPSGGSWGKPSSVHTSDDDEARTVRRPKPRPESATGNEHGPRGRSSNALLPDGPRVPLRAASPAPHWGCRTNEAAYASQD